MKGKVWIVLVLALVLSCASGALAAYDVGAVTPEAVAEANSRAALLANHESIRLETEFSLWNKTVVYNAKDYVYYQPDEELYDAAGGWEIVTDDTGRYVRYNWDAVEGSTAGELYLTADSVFNSATLFNFTVEGVRDNGDGTLTMTLAGEEGGFTELLESIDAADPLIPADAREKVDFLLDAETLEILSSEDYGVRTDGERMVVHRNVVTFDAPEPEGAAEIRAASAAFRAGVPADPRTITVVYNAGTPSEHSFTLIADRSFMVHPITYYGYDLWYSDAERTQVFESTDGSSDMTIYSFAPGNYVYVHDPRLNPKVLEDAVADENAVYGFRPSETGSLKMYADADWTDPAVVAAGRVERIAYHESLQSMYDKLAEMRAAGEDIETIARTLSAMRNELRLAAYADDPEGLAAIRKRNLEKYGHEEGPQADELYAQYGSWETVMTKAFSPNAAMDACLGFYDQCYELYIAANWVQDNSATPAQRQYAVTAIVDLFNPWVEDADTVLSDFADASEIDVSFIPEWERAAMNGLVKGYEDGTLRPRQTISRIEAFVLLSRCLPALEAAGEPAEFTDVPDWAKADIDRLSAAGLVEGYGDGTLGADDPLTVEQLYNILRRAMA